MTDLQINASEALKLAALNESAKDFLLNNPQLFAVLLKAAKRYIGGENLQEAIQTAKKFNSAGLPTSLEFMGESISSTNEANEVTQEFLTLIEAIKKENITSIVSLDLSHIGLAVDKELALDNFKLIAQTAKQSEIDVIISAEGVERTDEIIHTFCKISPDFPNVGLTLQAYLYRTPKDLERILKETQGKIRVVKGAFATPIGHSIGRGDQLDDVYINTVETLLVNNRKCSIATHHDKIQDRVKRLLDKHQTPKTNYEFEMLLGIREDLLNDLKKEGYPCRKYIVYGKEWYLYMCNRIAENPDNIFQAIIDIVM
ncbi:proline dehydrogenase family protein [Telluribacter humicola]|uniref:proline dehydrogenase family protein n=1 Tax=Telluribacter humicola TaxID=1720261 RepID=UPI001A969FC3|nr:proline dehydrogenase family protein [Telluribacter humicola]